MDRVKSPYHEFYDLISNTHNIENGDIPHEVYKFLEKLLKQKTIHEINDTYKSKLENIKKMISERQYICKYHEIYVCLKYVFYN